uniref:Uncharacterized protein n=1 Tax=Onchocerca volvulus TaxID=6282 RepID=A0A8R1TQB2_ONCVO
MLKAMICSIACIEIPITVTKEKKAIFIEKFKNYDRGSLADGTSLLIHPYCLSTYVFFWQIKQQITAMLFWNALKKFADIAIHSLLNNCQIVFKNKNFREVDKNSWLKTMTMKETGKTCDEWLEYTIFSVTCQSRKRQIRNFNLMNFELIIGRNRFLIECSNKLGSAT